MLRIIPVETNKDIEAARNVLGEYLEWLQSEKLISCQELLAFRQQLTDLPAEFVPPKGCLLLAKYKDEPAGCVALRKQSDGVCEGKRLYVREQFRGLKIGKGLVEAVIAEARRIGYSSIRGDTVPSMQSAQALYASLGFKEIEPYYHNPIEGAKFIELKL